MKIAIYPGSFDPVTLGHFDIIKRSAKMVDKLVIGVLNNSKKTPVFSVEERKKMLEKVKRDIPNVEVEAFQGLLVDFVKEQNATVIFRGLRAVSDFEYELQMAQLNRNLSPEVDTLYLATSVAYAYLSSSSVREVAKYHGDISSMVPAELLEEIKEKF